MRQQSSATLRQPAHASSKPLFGGFDGQPQRSQVKTVSELMTMTTNAAYRNTLKDRNPAVGSCFGTRVRTALLNKLIPSSAESPRSR